MKTQWSAGERCWAAGLFAVSVLWLGILLGVSFIATPAKFLAPSLTLPVALDVGRHTFAIFNTVEWGLAVTLLLLLAVGVRSWPSGLGALVACIMLGVETVWLLPLLDQRVALIIAGQPPLPSGRHGLYILFDAVKLLALVAIALDMARRLLRPSVSRWS